MSTKPADTLQDLQFFGEFGGVNPSIEDSSTYTFLHANTMEELFETAKELLYQEKMKDSVRLLGISLNNLNTEIKKTIVVQLKFDF